MPTLLRVALAFILLSLVVSLLNAKPPRSACNKRTQGRLWPEEANTSPRRAREMMRSGEVYMCSYGTLRYSWSPLSVNARTVRPSLSQATAGAGQNDQAANTQSPAEPKD